MARHSCIGPWLANRIVIYDWIGIYSVGRDANQKIDWVYVTTHRRDCSWTRIAPPPGEWEIAYLLDDTYDLVRARTRLTVLP